MIINKFTFFGINGIVINRKLKLKLKLNLQKRFLSDNLTNIIEKYKKEDIINQKIDLNLTLNNPKALELIMEHIDKYDSKTDKLLKYCTKCKQSLSEYIINNPELIKVDQKEEKYVYDLDPILYPYGKMIYVRNLQDYILEMDKDTICKDCEYHLLLKVRKFNGSILFDY